METMEAFVMLMQHENKPFGKRQSYDPLDIVFTDCGGAFIVAIQGRAHALNANCGPFPLLSADHPDYPHIKPVLQLAIAQAGSRCIPVAPEIHRMIR